MQQTASGSFFARRRELQDHKLDQSQTGEIRKFVGNGTEYLPVPGCKAVKYVRVGSTQLRSQWQHVFPINAKNTAMEIHCDWLLDTDEFGVPVLIRHKMSNFGAWQPGEEIVVGGEWDDTPPTASQIESIEQLTSFLSEAAEAKERADPRKKSKAAS